MATLEVTFLHSQLEDRKRRLQEAIALAPRNGSLAGLLHEVDSALDRMNKGTYGLCEECHDPVEQDRLLADPLVRYCLDHLTDKQRAALQRDLDLASEVQRNLLPRANFRGGCWDTSYHYAPLGPVSGDYCDLIPSDGQLFFVLGDVSGKGVAASMLMTQLHALFRSLTQRMAGEGDENVWKPVLAELDEGLVPAFIIEELSDGLVTVFVPSVPTPLAGAVHILSRERVHPVDIPFTQAIRAISRWGSGSGDMVAAMRKQNPSWRRKAEPAA